MPSVLTCVVAKRLYDKPTDDHWSVRDAAAEVVAIICHKYSSDYQKLQTRVTRTMVAAFLDASKPLTTHYGAITCLAKLGPLAVDVLIVDNVKAYGAILEKKMKAINPPVEAERRVRGALLTAVGAYLK